jgi:fimbrial chaperone protein
MRRFPAASCVFAAAAALWLSPAAAGSFSISPLRVDLSAQARTAALKVRNEDSHAVIVQVQAMTWSQSRGEETLEPTSDLLVSPPVFTLQPDAEQVLRVALRHAPDPSRELSYRLILQEVPERDSPDFTGLSMVLRLTLPAFVAPAVRAAPDLKWSLHRIDGKLRVRAENGGQAHARILNFKLAAGDEALEQSVVAYVLPGQFREWTLDDAGRFPGTVRLSGLTDEGDFAQELAVEP